MSERCSGSYKSWPHDLASLQQIGIEILEQWKEQHPHSPRYYPRASWLNNNGYSNLRWILQNKHDMTVEEFFVWITAAGGPKDNEWYITDIETIERLNAYINDQEECRNWAQSTKRSNKSRINEVLRRFSEEFDRDDIISIANNPELQTEVYDAFKQVAKNLRADFESDDSVFQYLRACHRFIEWLDRSSRIGYDPMSGLEKEFRWSWNRDVKTLTGADVRKLWIAAESDEERVMVIGYCLWGLRAGELPSSHTGMLDLENGKIHFESFQRKNGPGSVKIMYGFNSLARLLDKRARKDGWNGYFFPSSKNNRNGLTGGRMRKLFKDLCKKAGVTVDGVTPTPKYGRSFYYNLLAEAEMDLLKTAGKIAAEQGASDAQSVRDHYLTDSTQDRYRRLFVQQQIKQILPDSAHIKNQEALEIDRSLDYYL